MQPSTSSYGPLCVHEKAYLFFPSDKEQKTQFTKKGTRFFYYGQIEHDDYEKKKKRQFDEYLVKNKLSYNQEFYDDQKILLLLQSNSYDPKKTLQHMSTHLQFRKEYLPPVLEKVQALLKKGFFYVSGRDLNFRPVVVVNATMVDLNDPEVATLATIFAHEEIIKNMFIPGQVENWSVIYDLGGMGITQMPMSSIKTMTNKMSSNYGGRLFKMFTVNAPGTIWFLWKAVSAFLDDVTVEKIKISKKNTEQTLLKTIHPSQVEVKYGGTQPNRTVFFPFSIPEAVYDEKKLISFEQYEDKLKKGKLQKNIVHPKFRQTKE